MGKEATCGVQWGGESGLAKVLLETHELIVRGGELSRRSVPIASVREIEVRGDQLCFRAGEDAVKLSLGARQAQSWANKMAAPPPTLAEKLGIGAETHLALIGNFDAPELASAIAEAASTESRDPDRDPGLILAMVRTVADLDYALQIYAAYTSHPPIWMVYRKGDGKPIGEREIRDTLRRAGLMDTKVASVSTTLTALRFHWRG